MSEVSIVGALRMRRGDPSFGEPDIVREFDKDPVNTEELSGSAEVALITLE